MAAWAEVATLLRATENPSSSTVASGWRDWMVEMVREKPLPPWGTKGKDGLAREVIGLQEGVQGHGQVGVPVGVAQENHIVLVQVLDLAGQLRVGVLPQLVVGKLQQGGVGAGVLLDRLDGKQVAAHRLLDGLGDELGVARHPVLGGHPAGVGHGVGAVGLRHAEVGDQDIAPIGGRGFGAGGSGSSALGLLLLLPAGTPVRRRSPRRSPARRRRPGRVSG